MSNIYIYPHLRVTTKGREEFILGVEQFRDYLAKYLSNSYDAEYLCGRQTAKSGDTIVFAFRERDQWYFIGDGLVISKYHDSEDEDYPVHYHMAGVRLYPRNVGFEEFGEDGATWRRNLSIAPKIGTDEYMKLLKLSVTPPQAEP